MSLIYLQLKEILKGEVILEKDRLENYKRDASLFEIKPQAVVKAKDREDISNLVKFVTQNKEKYPKLSITPRSGGTDMSGGAIGESIVLDMSNLNRILKIDPQEKIAIVEPGVFYRDFEKETLKFNLILPSYPASKLICTVGGMVANNAGGEKSLKYGKTEKYVKELKVILRDGKEYTFKSITFGELKKKKEQRDLEGEIYNKVSKVLEENQSLIQQKRPKVSKNSAGYNLWEVLDYKNQRFNLHRLFIGAQGTLGVITEIKFKLVEIKPFKSLMVIFLKDYELVPKVVSKALKLHPVSFEVFDNYTLKLALKYFWEFAKILGLNLIGTLFNFLPDLWIILRKGVPKLILLVEFEGNSKEEVKESIEKLEEKLKNLLSEDLFWREVIQEREIEKYRAIRRESFNLLRHKIKNRKAVPFIDDLVVNPNYFPEFLPALYSILDGFGMIYTIAGHIGSGNLHIIPLVDLSNEKEREKILKVADEVFELVLKYEGSLTGEHNDGLIRTPYLEKQFGKEMIKVFKEVKSIFDPENIFNPYKKVGSGKELIKKFMRKD